MSDELLAIADELYALPLADFTPARDARAKELKGSDLAAPVKKLKKPVTLAQIKAHPKLSKMALVKKSRISVVPVTEEELALVLELAGTKV